MRKLASVQKILSLAPIPNADVIECATILGWQVVVRKAEDFQVGQMVVYCEIDSLFPKLPQFEFLKNSNYRLKTAKFRGQISQGLILPLTALPGDTSNLQEGDEVTDLLGITKYEAPIPVELQGEVTGSWPGCVPQTDETRIQSCPAVLDELRGQRCYATVKVDGTSSSFIRRDGEFWVCGHNWPYRELDGSNVHWRMCKKYGVESALRAAGNFAIQGETAGPGIQDNHYGLKEVQLFVFNVYDIDHSRYLDYVEFVAFCRLYGLQTVPIVEDNLVLDHTVEQLLDLAKGNYPGGHRREGLVIRTVKEQHSQALKGRASFKVVNNEYLLKAKD